MAKTKTLPWKPAEHLETEEDVAAYLAAALEEGDSSLVAAALGDIARAKGISPSGNPELATLLKVVDALGLRLHVTPAGTKSVD